jgi:hypothetical protein
LSERANPFHVSAACDIGSDAFKIHRDFKPGYPGAFPESWTSYF